MTTRRAAAIGALLLIGAGLVLAVVVAVADFPLGVLALAAVIVAGLATWYGILRHGGARVAGLAVGALAFAAAVVAVIGDRWLDELVVVAAIVLGCALARVAFGVRAELADAPA